MGMSGGKLDGEPMMDMNMTPLIDVLLVLLIMFIITIPVATHSVDIDLPTPQPPTNPPPIDPVKNKVVLTVNDQILWNGVALTEGELVATLQQTVAMPVEPELQFEPEPLKGSIRTLLAREPEAMHLTHYGRVGDVARLGADLLEQVDAMVALAWQAHAGAHDDVGRQVLLVDGLTRYYVTRARAHGVADANAVVPEVLGMDIELNAQGLGVWLARQEPAPIATPG